MMDVTERRNERRKVEIPRTEVSAHWQYALLQLGMLLSIHGHGG